MNYKISLKQTGYFSSLVYDYLSENHRLKSFYNRHPKLLNIKSQIDEKSKAYKSSNRKILVKVLNEQYKYIDKSDVLKANIELLKSDESYTITTGHQLNLFSGPLYFLYKIISVLNLCETLKKEYSSFNFVPIYWMASEDHDFDEINFFNFKNDKISWQTNQKGAVGEFNTDEIKSVLKKIKQNIGLGKNADELIELFENSYLKHDNLADATRFFANELFGKFGLVVLDANNKNLKELFSDAIQQELLEQTSFNSVINTVNNLKENYKIQVNPREINLFYIADNLRERIIKKDNEFLINNTDLKFSETEILDELNNYPERFSPNVLLRPLYQEIILPNLCYIGGSGEFAYWLELKEMFKDFKVTFPMYLLRNSALLMSEKQYKKIQKLNLIIDDLFLKQEMLKSKVTKQVSIHNFNFKELKEQLQIQFNSLKDIANHTEKSFLGALNALEKKQLNGIDKLEKRLLKAEKRKHKELLERVINLQNELFPNKSLQERNKNFSEFYLEYGKELIQILKNNLNPLDPNFTILKL